METNVETLYRRLWETLLNSDDGVDGQSYEALHNLGAIACPEFTATASRRVDATDGRFYLPGRCWRIRAVDAVDDDTGKPLEWSNEFGWVESGFGDEFDSRDGLSLPVGGEWVTA